MKPIRNNRVRKLREIFFIPLLLAALSSIGLISALLGDGNWDILSWLALLTPLLAIIWGLLPSKRENT